MKRILAVLLALLCLTLAFTSCGNKRHKPKVVEVVEPTCMAMGYTEYTCKHCGDYVADFTDALGHAYGEAVAISEETCTSRGVYEYKCVRCCDAHRYSIKEKGHDYVEVSADEYEASYVCTVCNDEVHIASGEHIEEYIGRAEIFDVEPSFGFCITTDADESFIRENLIIIDNYFDGTEYENDADVKVAFDLAYYDENTWYVYPTSDYEYDVTYVAKLSGGIKLTDYKGSELSFTVVDDPNHENSYQYNQGVVFLKNLENESAGYYPYNINTESGTGYLYLTVGKIDGLSKGQLLCIGDVKSISEIDSDTECYFGIVDGFYQLSEGAWMVQLAEPALSEIFNQFDIAYNEEVNLDDANINVEQLKADIVDALYQNEEFLEFLSAVHISSSSYLESKNCYSPELLDVEAFLNGVQITPNVSFSGKTLHAALDGVITLSIKNKEGKNLGELQISFRFDIESCFKVDVNYEISTGWRGVKIERFDVAMTQTDSVEFDFAVTVDADGLTNASKYVRNVSTGEVHLSCCVEVTRAAEGIEFESISAEDAQSADKKCSHCSPQGGESLEDDFRGYYIETIYCSDWEKVCADINKLLESSGNGIGTGVKLAGVKIPICGPVSVNLDLGFAISLDARAVLDYSCTFTQTSTYGMRLNHGYIQPYSKISSGRLTENELTILGVAEARVGLTVDAYVNISGLEKWINAGIGAEVGTYAGLSGCLNTEYKYMGAYLEVGVYLDINAFYRLVNNNGSADVAEIKKPVQKYGYEKLYFAYETYYDKLVINGSYDIAANDLLKVKYYDLVKNTIGTDELSLNEWKKYDVYITFADGSYCEISNGRIVCKSGAPASFSDTMYITVSAGSDWSQYKKGSAAFYLGTYEIDIEMHNSNADIGYGEDSQGLIFYLNEDGESYSISCKATGTTADIVIPSTYNGLPVTVINESAFSNNTYLKTVSIPNTVTTIGNSAFYGCTNLRGVTIPDSVVVIDGFAFFGCENLASVALGNSVESIGASAFGYCSSLEAITIPNSVTSIGNHAFQDCTALTSVTIGNSVISIGDYAFNNCAITSVIIPISVTNMGIGVFYECDSLTINCKAESQPSGWNESWNFSNIPVVWGGSGGSQNASQGLKFALNEDAESYSLIGVGTFSGANLEIPATYNGLPVTMITGYAFEGCETLQSLSIPDSVVEICDGAFNDCTSLRSVTMGANVQTIGAAVFMNCTSLWSVEMPNTVTSIGARTFENCTSLRSIQLPSSLTGISNALFNGCSALTSIVIPNYVTVIEQVAFDGCISLKSVIFGNSVKTIENSAFSHCESLTSIVLPDSVVSVGEGAFRDTYSLTVIYIPSSVTEIGQGAFMNGLDSVNLYCETDSKPDGWHQDWNLNGYDYKTGSYYYHTPIWETAYSDITITIRVPSTEGMDFFTKDQIAEFLAQHPEYNKYNIVVESGSYIDGSEDYLSTPDLYFTTQDSINKLVGSGLISPLDSDMAEKVTNNNDAVSVALSTVNGQLYAYPIANDNGYFLYYDTRYISDEEAKTIEGIIAACQRNNKKFAYNLTNAWYMAGLFFSQPFGDNKPLCVSNWTYDASGSKPISYNDTFNSQYGYIAMIEMNRIAKSGVWVDTADNFSGTAAIITGIWNDNNACMAYGDYMKAVKLPTFTLDGTTYQMGSYSGYRLIGVKPQNDSERNYILHALADYLTSEEAQLERYYEFVWLPSNKNASSVRDVQENYACQALLQQNAFAQPLYQVPPYWWAEAAALATIATQSNATEADFLQALYNYEEKLDYILNW